MGTWASSPSQFVAASKAKASEINAKFTNIYNVLTDGQHDLNISGIINNTIDTGSVDITSNSCYFAGYLTVDSTTTYKLKTDSSRMVIFGDLTINSGGTIDMTSGSELLVL